MISIIGGSGFVGTNLCRQLAQKNISFEIIDLKMSREFPQFCKIGDVRSLNSLRNKISGDLIVNLAAVHRDDVKDLSAYYRTNVQGAENICKVCTELNIGKVVFTSSVAVYGFVSSDTDESGKINPFNEYGKTKFEAEEKFLDWQRLNNSSLIIIRPTVIFGEGNRGNVYNLFNQIVGGKFVMIGNGKNKKSLAYIKNVVGFIDHCISSNVKCCVVNYADKPDLDMNTLVKFVRDKTKGKNNIGLRVPYVLGEMFGFAADLTAKVTRKKYPISAIRIKKFVCNTQFSSKNELRADFKVPFSLKEGLEATLESEFLKPDPELQVFYTE